MGNRHADRNNAARRALDTTFGPAHDGGGYAAFDQGGGLNDDAYAVAIDRLGRIVIGGWSQKNAVVGTAVMLKSNGQLERRFGSDGLFLQADPEAAESTILYSNRMLLSGDTMTMVGTIISPILLPGGVRNYDFGATRYALPLFSDDFEGDPP